MEVYSEKAVCPVLAPHSGKGREPFSSTIQNQNRVTWFGWICWSRDSSYWSGWELSTILYLVIGRFYDEPGTNRWDQVNP